MIYAYKNTANNNITQYMKSLGWLKIRKFLYIE